MPLDLNDFPFIVREALEILNRLSDRYTSTELGPLYTGKDYNSFSTFLDIYEINDSRDRQLVLEIVQHLDSKLVKKAVSKMKQEAKRIRNKTK